MGVHRGEGLMGSAEDKGFHGSIEAKDLVHELEGAHAQLDIFGAAWTRRRRTLSDVMRGYSKSRACPSKALGLGSRCQGNVFVVKSELQLHSRPRDDAVPLCDNHERNAHTTNAY